MITLLSKLIIKNNKDFKDAKVRKAYGVLCGAVGIFLNLCLFAFKFIAGSISGSIAITADAFNNLSDAGSSLITLVGFKMAGHKPDPDHPFGHGRIEYLSGLMVSVIIIIMAYELMKDSIIKIIHPESTEFSPLILVILIASILVKCYMAHYNKSVGKKIDSSAMCATATDSLSDTIATFVVLIGSVVAHKTGIMIDGYCGVIVSLFVCFAGIGAIKDTVGPLLGQAPDEDFVNQIEEIVMSPEHRELGILGIHDLIVHDYGPGRLMISLHAEVPSNGSIMDLHDLVDNIEHDLQTELNCHATIHMDPVLVDDEETNRMKAILDSIIETMNTAYKDRIESAKGKSKRKYKPITFHDFRIVKGPTHTNLIFDVVLPFDFDMNDDEVTFTIQFEVRKTNPSYFCVIEVDKAYA